MGQWITRSKEYHFEIQHKDKNKHQNADGLSKKTEYYRIREARIKEQPMYKNGFSISLEKPVQRVTYYALVGQERTLSTPRK